jgi:2-polyprenyl-3-methyl-5-hydroxy-6-metoxy-1,4-benzoquinol methylase
MNDEKAANEIAHAKRLAQHDADDAWGWRSPAGRARVARRAELIARGAGLKSGMRVLEVGCGTGIFTENFAGYEIELLAVDISEELLAKARLRAIPTGRVRFLCKRFEESDFEGQFDAIIGSSVLHHLDIAVSLHRMYELLCPGGCLAFAEPNMLNPQVYLERKLKLWYVSPDEIAFVRWRLARQLNAIGFLDVRVVPFDWLHPSTPEPFISLVRSTGLLLERIPFLREFAGSLSISARRPPIPESRS